MPSGVKKRADAAELLALAGALRAADFRPDDYERVTQEDGTERWWV
jgi:hypothetical protein